MFGRDRRTVQVRVFGKTDLGRTRDHNEDRFLVADLTRRNASLLEQVREHGVGERGSLFVVADGMGGAAAGELASEMATETIYSQLVDGWANDADQSAPRFAARLKEAVEAANGHIHAYQKAHPEVRGMGTTATALGILGDQAFVSQVGDSRAYLVRGGTAYQITKDQSLTQRLVEVGEMTEEQAAKSDRKNIILQALGPDPRVKVDLTHQALRRGDILVVCSDGLSGQVTNDEIAQIVSQSPSVQAACDRLIALANERGGPDNITVVVAQVDGDGLRGPGPDESVGHQVYPLVDTETSTEPVPVYRGSRPPEPSRRVRLRTVIVVLLAVLLLGVGLYLSGIIP
jgi:protein phosphatase